MIKKVDTAPAAWLSPVHERTWCSSESAFGKPDFVLSALTYNFTDVLSNSKDGKLSAQRHSDILILSDPRLRVEEIS